ncbi:uncharacterized protein B0H18DRAFT_23519 [Fomitopsis serialis]|uniref:uncharacterized protein n=1 Tax=Fomitopsis serialis TaxID=139415 RepID=UPI002007DE2C|nr:uncharacterized protein B0H18DRAFT_23519 [Neoantrodia serialis]KAH9938696.1 hypothetical protein B0H18DRAFT_23519 [Neoantrodia serialis]
MIHLDRSHSSAIAGHAKSNLILADPPHADQHSILSWSPSTHTDTPFYHDPQEPFTLTSDAPKHTITSDPAPAQKQDQPVPATTNHGPITPGDAEEPKLPEPSPSSPAGTRSPVAETSSSLSPPPDAATPSAVVDPGATAEKPPASAGEAAAGGTEAPTEVDEGNFAEEVEKASRAPHHSVSFLLLPMTRKRTGQRKEARPLADHLRAATRRHTRLMVRTRVPRREQQARAMHRLRLTHNPHAKLRLRHHRPIRIPPNQLPTPEDRRSSILHRHRSRVPSPSQISHPWETMSRSRTMSPTSRPPPARNSIPRSSPF